MGTEGGTVSGTIMPLGAEGGTFLGVPKVLLCHQGTEGGTILGTTVAKRNEMNILSPCHMYHHHIVMQRHHLMIVS